MTTTFEDRLLTELKREVALAAAGERRPAARRRLVTPGRAGLGLAGAAAVAAAFVLLPGGAGTPAYAVERTGDGGIVVHISQWPEGAEEVDEFARMLRDAGVATVSNPPEGYLCRPFDDDAAPGAPGKLPPPPPGADTAAFTSVAGGATVIGPEVARAHAPDGGEPGDGEQGTTGGEAEDFTYHLDDGDTVILTEGGGAGSITFIDGACDPVPDAG
ncbi:hypothetical protein [Streptomyces sp. URMC 129]|uniref:hypothetical protein n=1 Tax=Streptomyces sp. URMC 129 TaxID=3423407 RepID=UPI003F19B9A9